jgi:hypothetical protein
VHDPAGAPLPFASVNVLQWRFYDGERKYLNVDSLTADARGEYRAFGLEAGEYLIAVDATDGQLADASYEFVAPGDADVDRALQIARQPSPSGAPQAAKRLQTFGFASTYFPGTTDAARGTRVTLGSGEERSGVDVQLDMVPLARLEGAVTSLDGPLPPRTRATLAPSGPPVPNYRFVSSGGLGPKTIDAAGHFTYAGVPPGEYTITIAPAPAPAGRGADPSPAAKPAMTFAFATLTVAGDDQRIDLTLQPAMTMSGRFAFEGAPTPQSLGGTFVSVQDLRIEQSGFVRARRADASADGAFQVGDLWPGRFLFQSTGPDATWFVKSATAGGRDLLDAPFELKPGDRVEDLVVTFTTHPSELAGHLQTAVGAPATDYFIVVFSADRQYWFPNSRRVASVRATSAGDYSVKNLPAGDYCVAAVTDVELGEWFDPPFLESLLNSAKRFTIATGERKVQNLQIGGR